MDSSDDKHLENIDLILNNGLDIKNRIIYHGKTESDDDSDSGDVSWQSIEQVIRCMNILCSIDDKAPIVLCCSSVGGDESQMFRLIDHINMCPVKVIFKGSGEIKSSMVWIMAVCDYRIITQNTSIMIHDGSSTLPSARGDQRIWSDHDLKLIQKGHQILAENTKIDIKTWSRLCQKDLFIDAQEALTIGLVDEVIKTNKRSVFRSERFKSLKRNRRTTMLSKISEFEKRIYIKS